MTRALRTADALIPVVSIVASLALWEVISRTGVISARDLPSMSASFSSLWDLVQTWSFWHAFLQTVRGWALGLGVATMLAVPLGIVLGTSPLTASAFRVPIEFLRPIPSAALIPLLFLTLGTNLKSEVFLAAFGAFWPLLDSDDVRRPRCRPPRARYRPGRSGSGSSSGWCESRFRAPCRISPPGSGSRRQSR